VSVAHRWPRNYYTKSGAGFRSSGRVTSSLQSWKKRCWQGAPRAEYFRCHGTCTGTRLWLVAGIKCFLLLFNDVIVLLFIRVITTCMSVFVFVFLKIYYEYSSTLIFIYFLLIVSLCFFPPSCYMICIYYFMLLLLLLLSLFLS